MSNLKLQQAAIEAINDPDFVDTPGMCSKFSRQVVESLYGKRFADCFGASAKETALNFLDGCNADAVAFRIENLPQHGGALEPGDIVYKIDNAGAFGHVGIYVGNVPGVGNDLIAENSSTHTGRIRGACGYRSVGEWGRIEAVVRLPSLDAAGARLIVALAHQSGWIYTAIASAQYDGHEFTVNLSDLAGSVFGKAADPERLPFREALAKLGYTVSNVKDRRDDATDPRFYAFVTAA